ncbi:MAG: histidine kinase dimerization/phospho-acceptor domain-containing protein, partial [Burkholderiales bacterium]
MKIRSHLYLLALGAIVPLLIVSVIAGTVLVRYDRETFEREALGRARSAMTAVNAELRGSISTAQALAASKSLAAGDIRAFHDEARRVLENQQQDWRNIGLATVGRVQLMNALEPYGATSPFGSDDPSFDLAIRTRRPTIGDIIPGPVVKDPVVRIRVPVIVHGNVRYVISVPIDPVSMQKVLAAQQMPDGWTIGLVDRSRNFIARIPPLPVGSPVSKDFKAAIERAPQGWYRGRTLEGTANYTPYVSSAISGWVLGIAIPASLVEAAAWHTFWLTFSGVLFALAVALALAWVISRRIADPIAALAVAAEGVSTGIDVALPATPHIDEIERLNDTLLASSRAVRERQALLETERATLREQAALLNLAHDAIMVRTTAGIINFWSSGAEEIYGWSSSEAIGRDVTELLRTEFPRAQGEIESEFERTGRWDGILQQVRKDGARIVVASRWALRRAQSGSDGIVLAINSDITRQTTAEQSAARLNTELMEANQRKDHFLATLAHELRNPLAPITNCVTMLKAADIPDREKARARDVIERQVGQMARLLDDLLDMSRITHGKLELRRQRVELAQVVDAAVETCRPQIESGGHNLII